MLKKALIGLTILNLALCCFCVMNVTKTKKIAYIDVLKLLDEYKMQLDLGKKNEATLNQLRFNIDSLKIKIQLLSKGTDAFNQMADKIIKMQYAYSQATETKDKETSKQVWDRLNPLIFSYGKEMSYKMILGGTGSGNLLYADPEIDCTADFINYANKNYETGK